RFGPLDEGSRYAAAAQLGLLRARDDRRALERDALGQHHGSPTRAPPVVTSLSFATSPSIAPTTIGRSRPCVISVWPPTSATSSSSHAAWSSAKIDVTDASVVVSDGSRSVARNQRGRAPRTAMSLALTWSAYQPISSVAKVIGSVVATR